MAIHPPNDATPPPGVDWLSNARFGPGVRDILEGLEVWIG